MITACFLNAKQHIYGLATEIGIDQQRQNELLTAVSKIEQECLRNGSSYEVTLKEMLNPIIDVLYYGNWPRVQL